MKQAGLVFTFLLSLAVQAEPVVNYEKEAEAVAGQLLKELGSALKKQIQEGGPEQAVKVCSELAPEIVNRLSIEKGWRITRVGTRVRNPLLGTPDRWEQEALAYFERRAAGGNDLKDMSYSEIVEEPAGRYFRYMKPLVIKPLCMICHGEASQIPDTIKKTYPHDRATGYHVGDLRGGIVIKRPLSE